MGDINETELAVKGQILILDDGHVGVGCIIFIVYIFEIFHSKFKKQTKINIRRKNYLYISQNLWSGARIIDIRLPPFSLSSEQHNSTYFKKN